ncbi:FAD-linked oxidase [Streptomyces xanthochromogenes]
MTSTVTRRRFVKRTATGVGVAAVGTGLGAGIFAPPAATAAGESTGSTAFGPVTVASTDSRYADLRRGTNQRFEGNPESIRLVGSTSQVVAAVQSAVSAGKKIAVRSGGHCYEDFVANAAVKVVIDLSAMNAVGFDSGRNAFVIEAGAKLGQVYERLFKGWGVTVPGGACPTVGAGGHIQGGGYGALSRRYGLISDHLYAVEVVVVDRTGTAKAVVATREAGDPNRDLWWAHTGGGGGNFGVVTRYWMRAPGATRHPAITRRAAGPRRPPSGRCAILARWQLGPLRRRASTRRGRGAFGPA